MTFNKLSTIHGAQETEILNRLQSERVVNKKIHYIDNIKKIIPLFDIASIKTFIIKSVL